MPEINSYSSFQAAAATEKIALCIVEASKRLMGWTVDSGSVYELTGWDYSVITALSDSGTAYTSVASKASITAGTYYNDRTNRILYLQASDSSNPNSRFIACTVQLFFSNASGVAIPYDLNTGFDIDWLPYVQDVSQFQISLDNQYQMGDAIQGTGNLVLLNDQSYWPTLFDKVYFENQNVYIYSWHRNLPITQAQLLYKGRIYAKKYTATDITFSVKDLLSQLNVAMPLATISALGSKKVTPSILNAFQRTVYGRVFGMRPMNIDQVTSGYPMTGTVTVTNGSATLVGSSSLFLTELRKDDKIFFTSDTTGTSYTVKQVTSNTAATLTVVYGGLTHAGSAMTQVPALPKRWQNRIFQIAGHILCEPSTTIATGYTTTMFDVVSGSRFQAGDTVTVAGQSTTIKDIVGVRVNCNGALNVIPSPGDAVKRATISAAYLGSQTLTATRDYTYDPTAATITLDKLAEYNLAPRLLLPGTSTAFVNGSTAVVGTGTFYTKYLTPGCWVKDTAQADSAFREVLEVVDDTHLTLVTAAGYNSATATVIYLAPNYYTEGTSVLSIDLIGKTSDGTLTGPLIATGPDVVKDLLSVAGLSGSTDTTSFSNAATLAPQPLGLVIPTNYTDTTAPKFIDLVSQVNQNVFGSLVQSSNFLLQYSIFSPTKPASRLKLKEADILSWSIDAKMDNIVKTVQVNYLQKEYDYLSNAGTFLQVTNTSKNAQYLAGSTGIKTFPSILTTLADATTLAGRLGFILEYSATVFTVATKLQAMTTNINDTVEIDHEKMYQRIGSSSNRKIAAVLGYRKSPTDVELDLEDLSNAFSRCACIADSAALSYSNASEAERVKNGYYTDLYGMQSNDPTTFNTNLYW